MIEPHESPSAIYQTTITSWTVHDVGETAVPVAGPAEPATAQTGYRRVRFCRIAGAEVAISPDEGRSYYESLPVPAWPTGLTEHHDGAWYAVAPPGGGGGRLLVVEETVLVQG